MNLYDDEIYDHGLDFVGQRLFRDGHQEGSSPFDRHLVDPGRVGLLRNTVIEEQTQGGEEAPSPAFGDRHHRLDPLGDQSMVVQRRVQRNIGGAIDHIGEEFPGEGAPPVAFAENVDPLLDPDDHPLLEKCGDLVAGTVVFTQAIQQGLVIELLAGDPLAQFFQPFSFTLVSGENKSKRS